MTGETFGAMLRRHRLSVGLSQNQLARQSGIDPAYVNRLEKHGSNQVSRAVALRLADVLELTESQTDRFLFTAGLAPVEDWQTRAVRAEYALERIGEALHDATRAEEGEPSLIRRIG